MKRGDIIAVVGAKGDIEVEVLDDGVIVDLLAQPGTEVLVGNPIAIIRGLASRNLSPPQRRPNRR